MAEIPQSPVNDRGQQVLDRFPLREGEVVSLAFADPLLESKGAYLALVTRRGQVRRIGSQYLGKHLQDGTVLYNVAEGGAPAAACWTSGNDELFIVTQAGKAIRFAERLVPVRGCLGMRVDPRDMIAGIAAARPEDGVFMLSSEGKGTIRLLSGFGANKSPGAGGKIAMRAENVVDVVAVDADYDLFAISLLGKIIRFRAEEIPAKEGVVQGVNCMSLRADECVAIVGSPGGR
jgi:DNA gyrase subunit A